MANHRKKWLSDCRCIISKFFMVMHTLVWIFLRFLFFLSNYQVIWLWLYKFFNSPSTLNNESTFMAKKFMIKKSYWIVLLNNQEMPRKTTCGDTVLVMPCILLPHAPNFCHCSRKVAKITERCTGKISSCKSIRKAHLRSVKSCKDIYRILKREDRGMYEDW